MSNPLMEWCIQSIQNLANQFDPSALRGDDIEIQFMFNDQGQKKGCYLHLLKGKCTFHDGEALFPKLTLKIDCSVWKSILDGELSWEKALMERRFVATGNFPLLAQVPKIFKLVP